MDLGAAKMTCSFQSLESGAGRGHETRSSQQRDTGILRYQWEKIFFDLPIGEK